MSLESVGLFANAQMETVQKDKSRSPSLVGKGFFSWVCVFFSLVLSKLVISIMSGLSAMTAMTKQN